MARQLQFEILKHGEGTAIHLKSNIRILYWDLLLDILQCVGGGVDRTLLHDLILQLQNHNNGSFSPCCVLSSCTAETPQRRSDPTNLPRLRYFLNYTQQSGWLCCSAPGRFMCNNCWTWSLRAGQWLLPSGLCQLRQFCKSISASTYIVHHQKTIKMQVVSNEDNAVLNYAGNSWP